MADQIPTYEEVEIKRRGFSRILKSFLQSGGRYHNPARELPQSKFDGCEVLNNRLALLDRLPKGGVVVEVGVDRGDFSQQIRERCQPAELHLLDIDLDRLANPSILSAVGDPNEPVSAHAGDSSTLLSGYPDEYFDIIYIDADHKYYGVKKDIEAAVSKIKPNGHLVFNDYAVWSTQTMFHCGVARAVNEFCLRNPWKMRYLALQPLMYNDVALVREA